MISTSGCKCPELIRKIQSHEEAPQTLEGLFTLTELDELRSIANSSYNKAENTQRKLLKSDGQALGNMAHPRGEDLERLNLILREKLKPSMNCDYEMAFTFHRNYFPYGTHTDSGYDEAEFIYKQGIIPLEVEPCDKDVYTVIFAQKAYHSISYPSLVETIRSLRADEIGQIYGYDSSKTLSDAELETLFQGPKDKERFRGFEVALPFRWRLGDMALWDRAHLHCSSDFDRHGIKGKMGLMWISWRV